MSKRSYSQSFEATTTIVQLHTRGEEWTSTKPTQIARVIKARSDKRQCTYNGNGAVSNSGTIISMLPRLTKGDGALNQYSGEFIDWRWLRLRVINRVAATDSVDSIRTILFQWDDSVAPTVGNVIDISGVLNPL